MLKLFKKSQDLIAQKNRFNLRAFVTNKNSQFDTKLYSFKFMKNKQSPKEDTIENTDSFNSQKFIDHEHVPPINMDITEDRKINSKIFSDKRKTNKSKMTYFKHDENQEPDFSSMEEEIPKNNFRSQNKEYMNSSKPKNTKGNMEKEDAKEHINIEDYFDMNENSNNKDKDELNNEKEEGDKQNSSSNEKAEYLYGIHSVEAILKHKFRIAKELYVLYSYKGNQNEHINKLILTAESQNIKVKYMTQGKLDKFTSNRHNDGLVIKCERRKYSPLRKFKQFSQQYLKKEKGNLVILLDKVTDPQNFGSIIRSCLFIGVEKIIVNKLHCPPISPAVSKISLGASESVELFTLKFTNNFISEARKEGWKIIATGCEKENAAEKKTEDADLIKDESEEDIGEDTTDKEKFKSEKIELKDLTITKDDNVIAILGSESLGVSKKLLESANYQVYIPPVLNKNLVGKFPFDIVDSLNVAVTTGIILNHIKYLQRKDVKKKEMNKNL